MLDCSKPKTLRELIHYLHEKPDLTVQNSITKKKIRFDSYIPEKNGMFKFDNDNYNFFLHGYENEKIGEIGLTIVQKGFIVECGDKSTTFYFGKSAVA